MPQTYLFARRFAARPARGLILGAACALALGLSACSREDGANSGSGNSSPTPPATTAPATSQVPAAADGPAGGSTGPQGVTATEGASGAGAPNVSMGGSGGNQSAPMPATTASNIPTPPPPK